MVPSEIRKPLEEFLDRLEGLYGSRLEKVVLYGSYARGDYSEESDVDLIVVLRGSVVPSEEIDRMIDAITDVNLEYGVLLSIYPVSLEEYVECRGPLLMNIKKEGIVVWSKNNMR